MVCGVWSWLRSLQLLKTKACGASWQVRADVPAEVRWAVAEKVISDAAIVSGVAGWAACGCAVLVQSPQRGLPRVRPPKSPSTVGAWAAVSLAGFVASMQGHVAPCDNAGLQGVARFAG